MLSIRQIITKVNNDKDKIYDLNNQMFALIVSVCIQIYIVMFVIALRIITINEAMACNNHIEDIKSSNGTPVDFW